MLQRKAPIHRKAMGKYSKPSKDKTSLISINNSFVTQCTKVLFPVKALLLPQRSLPLKTVLGKDVQSMSVELKVVAQVILKHKRAIPKSTQLVNAHPFLKCVGPMRFNCEENDCELYKA